MIVTDAMDSEAVRRVARRLREWGDDFDSAVYSWLRGVVRFRLDPRGVEYLRTPDEMIAAIIRDDEVSADCDDVASLGASLLAAGGVRPVFLLASYEPEGEWDHVFFGSARSADVSLHTIVPLDPQERIPVGVYPPKSVAGRVEWRPAVVPALFAGEWVG